MKLCYTHLHVLWATSCLALLSNTLAAQHFLSNPSGCQLHLPIFDNSCTPNHDFHINTYTAPGTTLGTDVFLREIRIIVYHEWDADLDITLRSPSGKTVELSTDNGGGKDHYGNPSDTLCLEFTAFLAPGTQEACGTGSIRDGQAPFVGYYLPEGNLNDFNDGTSPLGEWILTICDDGKEHFGFLEYAELVFEATDCLTPSNLQVLQTASNFVMLTWDAGSSCGNSLIEIGAPGFEPGTGNTPGDGFLVQAACPPLTVSGLSPSTTFEVYVREMCAPAVFSENSCPVIFTTQCAPPPATLIENFDSQSLCPAICGTQCLLTGIWHNATYDDFDWIINEGASATANTGPSDDFPGGGRYAYMETSGIACRNGNVGILYSNCISVVASADTCDLSFNYSMYGTHVNSLHLEVSTDGGHDWVVLWQAFGDQGPNWYKAFVDLSAYPGQTVQFRFRGIGGTGFRGDIAIDNIVFYGSVDSGAPPYLYYRDEDGDGYGNADKFIASCAASGFPGYVSQGGDCDDQAPWINPGLLETPCDGMDANCNGMDDENELPAPAAMGDTICSGAVATIVAFSAFGGAIHWYQSVDDTVPVHIGDTLFLNDLPANNSPNILSFSWYAAEQTPHGCASASRTLVAVLLLPRPDISANAMLDGCRGETIDLTATDIIDANTANASFIWYRQPPFIPTNEVSHVVMVLGDALYYTVATAEGGCQDTLAVPVAEKPTPLSEIVGESLVCKGDSALLIARDTGSGLPPLIFSWNNGATDDSLIIAGLGGGGQPATYEVTITGTNGCSSLDTIETITITSIDSIQVNVGPVSTCGASNGSIHLQPLDGVPPFNYLWPGGQAVSSSGFTITGLHQGSYSITIVDNSAAGCPFILPFVIVNGPAAVINVNQVDPVSCAGGGDGCIKIEVLGNNPVIQWSNGASGETNCGLAADTYMVTVTEGSCQNVLSIAVPEPQPLFAKAVVDPINCNGSNNAFINLSVFGGTPPYQYLWNNGFVTKNIGLLGVGTYSVSITDARGCQYVLNDIIVAQPDPVSFFIEELQLPLCTGDANGLIAIQPTGGNGFYSISWSNGASGSVVNNLASGNYTFTIVDQKGCTGTGQVPLPDPPLLQVALGGVQNPTCKGSLDGAIDIVLSGGAPGYTYLWDNGAQVEDLLGIGDGDYSVTVSDGNGCSATLSNVHIEAPGLLELEAELAPPTCNGIDDGFIEVEILAGGQAPYQYLWSTGAASPALSDLAAGEYGLTITDGNNCLFDTLYVLDYNQPIAVTSSVFEPACYETNTGQIVLSIEGDAAPFFVLWNTGNTGTGIGGLSAGAYTATITDANGCVLFLPLIELGQPAALSIEAIALEGVVCPGGSEGRIDVAIDGGTAPYQFLWSNGAQSEDIDDAPEGIYQVAVTDAQNCVTMSDPYIILAPDPICVDASQDIPAPCTFSEVEDLCLNVNGGQFPYHFFWNTGDTTSCLLFPASGEYSVTVTDALGCTRELTSIKVQEPYQPPGLQFLGGRTDLCAGEANGRISVAVAGGNRPYQYIWSNGASGLSVADTLVAGGLGPGNYSLTVTDATGCTQVLSDIVVKSYPLLSVHIPAVQITHVKCRSGSDGGIDLNVNGGLPPYSYLWKNAAGDTVGITQDVAGLSAGAYTVYVVDSLGCFMSAGAEIAEPESQLSILDIPPMVDDISCSGLQDGSISITPMGGIPPYQIEWDNGAGTEDISGLGAGVYGLTITDANNCALIPQPFQIEEPGPLHFSDHSVVNVSCYGEKDGSIDVDVAGGTAPLFYNWSLPSVNEDLFGLPGGEYALSVFDNNGCDIDTTFIVDEPPVLELFAGAEDTAPNDFTGIAWAFAMGGVPPYVFSWSNSQTGDTIKELGPGWYEVVVTDANFCTQSAWVEVMMTVAVQDQQGVELSYKLYPNPVSSILNVELVFPTAVQASLSIWSVTGVRVQAAEEELFTEGRFSLDVSAIAPGVYYLSIQANGKRVAGARVLILR